MKKLERRMDAARRASVRAKEKLNAAKLKSKAAKTKSQLALRDVDIAREKEEDARKNGGSLSTLIDLTIKKNDMLKKANRAVAEENKAIRKHTRAIVIAESFLDTELRLMSRYTRLLRYL
jgi:hypothetical protein